MQTILDDLPAYVLVTLLVESLVIGSANGLFELRLGHALNQGSGAELLDASVDDGQKIDIQEPAAVAEGLKDCVVDVIRILFHGILEPLLEGQALARFRDMLTHPLLELDLAQLLLQDRDWCHSVAYGLPELVLGCHGMDE